MDCNTCNIKKELDQFHHFTRPSGKVYYLKRCKICESHRLREKYKTDNNRKRRQREYANKNRDKIKKYQEEYHKRPEVSERRNAKRRQRRKKDENYRLYCNISSRITKKLQRNKSKRTVHLLGCNIDFFKQWIEWQFNSNMNWDNYGKYWQIDHVKPCNSFEFTNKKHQEECFNWKNCRPMKSYDNITKSDKLIPYDIVIQELKVKIYATNLNCSGNP